MKLTIRTLLLLIFGTLIGATSFQSSNHKGKNYALFIAIDQYNGPDFSALRNPVRDAEALASVLSTRFDFIPEIHRNPKHQEIGQILSRWQRKYFGDQDQLFIFFTGHGDYNETYGKGYFIPAEAGHRNDRNLPMDHIRSAVNRINCRHIMLALDACYSGAIHEKGRMTPPPKRLNDPPEAEKIRFIASQLASQSRFLLSSGNKKMRSWDGQEHSPFTSGILNALGTSIRENKVLYFEALSSYLVRNVHPEPEAGLFEGHEGGGFVFVPKEINVIDRESQLYQEALSEGTVEALETFLKFMPESQYASAARIRIRELRSQRARKPKPVHGANYGKTEDNWDWDDTKPRDVERVADLDPYPKMVPINGGSFVMGIPGGKEGESPAHRVLISDFYMSQTEITNDQYVQFVLDSYGHDPEWSDPESPRYYVSGENAYYREMGESLTLGNYPVVGVSWEDAMAYCQWLSKKTGETYRLPTEAEFEYAAGGGNNPRTVWAGTSDKLDLRKFVNYGKTGGSDRFEFTAPVKSFYPNEVGLFDMSGNVAEWCGDWFNVDYYDDCRQFGTVRDPKGPQYNSEKVVRGGSWISLEKETFSIYYRANYRPETQVNYIGFRVVRER